MSFDKKTLPGWKAARAAMCHITVEQFDDICLVIDQAYARGAQDELERLAPERTDFYNAGYKKGVEHMLAKAQEANQQQLQQRLIDAAIVGTK